MDSRVRFLPKILIAAVCDLVHSSLSLASTQKLRSHLKFALQILVHIGFGSVSLHTIKQGALRPTVHAAVTLAQVQKQIL